MTQDCLSGWGLFSCNDQRIINYPLRNLLFFLPVSRQQKFQTNLARSTHLFPNTQASPSAVPRWMCRRGRCAWPPCTTLLRSCPPSWSPPMRSSASNTRRIRLATPLGELQPVILRSHGCVKKRYSIYQSRISHRNFIKLSYTFQLADKFNLDSLVIIQNIVKKNFLSRNKLIFHLISLHCIILSCHSLCLSCSTV